MQDFIPLGTGNSRSLKSAVPAGTTWEQALEMLRNGTFPIDIGAVNDAGVAQKGSPINKTTLLKDATASLFQLGADAVPDDVLKILSKAALVGEGGTLVTPAGEKTGFSYVSGSYTGTGTYGTSKKNTLSFSGNPVLLFVSYKNTGLYPSGNYTGWKKSFVWYDGVTQQDTEGVPITISKDGNSVSWHSLSAEAQLNERVQYYYFALVSLGG